MPQTPNEIELVRTASPRTRAFSIAGTLRAVGAPLALAALVLLGLGLDPIGRLSAREKHYGFVDMEEVIGRADKNTELSRRLEDKVKGSLEALKKEEEAIRLDREGLAILSGDKREAAVRGLRLREQALEYDRNRLLVSMDQDKVKGWRELYAYIRSAALRVAERRGLDAVLVANRSLPEGKTEEEIVMQISLRSVLHFDEGIDVTDDVIAELNR